MASGCRNDAKGVSFDLTAASISDTAKYVPDTPRKPFINIVAPDRSGRSHRGRSDDSGIFMVVNIGQNTTPGTHGEEQTIEMARFSGADSTEETVISLGETSRSTSSSATASSDNRMSVRYLKKKFAEVEIEELYQLYWLRSQRASFRALLAVLVLYAVVLVLLFHFHHNGSLGLQNSTNTMGRNLNIVVITGGILAIILFILVSIEKVFLLFSKPLTLLVWFSLLSLAFGFSGILYSPSNPSFSPRTAMDDVPTILYTIFDH
ncbi:uncharacterized protein LOC106156372 [Lingula anatina]|uniref:Uncharacterized protein LOC106156372 n=1 Tax=Lingula anatina TaxID=7574 RepID=A0A1S3HLZ4_LINAN|nr:uncharacterized protein LOC106156372 [Lingula anatina]|eukprot:XP_013387047.1 uncharacterized protein LOC106156372 [Lingula anatina]